MPVSAAETKRKAERIKRDMLPGEMEAVLDHKYHLSRKAGRDVGLDYAILHWHRYHARRWRSQRMKEEVECQICEMLKHKWIESEKAGRDLGKDALIDWIRRHAKEWREDHYKKR